MSSRWSVRLSVMLATALFLYAESQFYSVGGVLVAWLLGLVIVLLGSSLLQKVIPFVLVAVQHALVLKQQVVASYVAFGLLCLTLLWLSSSSSRADKTAERTERTIAEIRKFYFTHNPDHLTNGKLDENLRKYRGREELLLDLAKKKYAGLQRGRSTTPPPPPHQHQHQHHQEQQEEEEEEQSPQRQAAGSYSMYSTKENDIVQQARAQAQAEAAARLQARLASLK